MTRSSSDDYSDGASLRVLRRETEARDPTLALAFGAIELLAYIRKPDGVPDASGFAITAGSDLLSHAVSHTVPSAVAGLTSVFGMGTGVTLLL